MKHAIEAVTRMCVYATQRHHEGEDGALAEAAEHGCAMIECGAADTPQKVWSALQAVTLAALADKVIEPNCSCGQNNICATNKVIRCHIDRDKIDKALGTAALARVNACHDLGCVFHPDYAPEGMFIPEGHSSLVQHADAAESGSVRRVSRR